ncbi:hypothetical protein [Nonomuraea sp. NPDC049695]|uniref:hypothetical protein n=1 Tax=Nonomuraea sp. NPDC049695 TaxID=3154734 RepID=UPI003415DC52
MDKLGIDVVNQGLEAAVSYQRQARRASARGGYLEGLLAVGSQGVVPGTGRDVRAGRSPLDPCDAAAGSGDLGRGGGAAEITVSTRICRARPIWLPASPASPELAAPWRSPSRT